MIEKETIEILGVETKERKNIQNQRPFHLFILLHGVE
jgi:hypothetical protein